MNDKIKSVLSKDITIEDLKTHKKLTALVAVFFICMTIFLSEVFSNLDEMDSKNISEPIKKSKQTRIKSKPSRELLHAEPVEKFETIDPFSPEHLTEKMETDLEFDLGNDFDTDLEFDLENPIETKENSSVENLKQYEEKNSEEVQKLETVPEIKKIPFELKGILYDGRNSVVIIDQNGEKTLSIGESIDQRKILDIQPDFIVLDTGEKFYIEF